MVNLGVPSFPALPSDFRGKCSAASHSHRLWCFLPQPVAHFPFFFFEVYGQLSKSKLVLLPPPGIEYGSLSSRFHWPLSSSLSPLPPVLCTSTNALLMDWLDIWLSPSHFLCFPFKELGPHYFFFQCTHNGELADSVVIIAEFDKKCIGLKLIAAPLTLNFKSFHFWKLLLRRLSAKCCKGMWWQID